MLEIFQDISEIYKIIVFQTDSTVQAIADRIGYSREHLTGLLKGKGTEKVRSDLRDTLIAKYQKEILQFVRVYGKRGTSEDQQTTVDNTESLTKRLEQIEINLNAVHENQSTADARLAAALEVLFEIHLKIRPERTVQELLAMWGKKTTAILKKKPTGIHNDAGKKGRSKVVS